MKSNRIEGLDLARAFAIIGMIIVNFKVAFNAKLGYSSLINFIDLFDGKAAALFIILAGVGISLMTNSARINKNKEKLKSLKNKLLKRALFLFVIGIAYMPLWNADILHYYGFYILFAIIMIKASNRLLWILSTVLILIYPLLVFTFNYETAWDWKLLEYIDFWTIKGFIRNLVFNGFHPLIPWLAFLLIGMWLGRQDLKNKVIRKKIALYSLVVFTIAQITSVVLVNYFSNVLTDWNSEDIFALFGTAPMPPMPFYFIVGTSFGILMIILSIYLAEWFAEKVWMVALINTGRIALSMYFAHVVLGMGVIMIFTGEYVTWNILYSLTHAIIFCFLTVLFANYWLEKRQHGPLEWIMRKIS